jgi:putative NADPH-quinone reductase
MTSILVINANPDPSPDRLSAALATAYAQGARETGHTVQFISVGELSFPLLRNSREFLVVPADPEILAARKTILEAEHIVFIYPLWLGGPPALLKGFMEQVACGEFALSTGAHGLPKGNLKGRSARVIVTMGMPAIFYRLFYGAHGVIAFNRSVLGIAGIRPIRTSYLGGVGGGHARCIRMVKRLHRMGRRAE